LTTCDIAFDAEVVSLAANAALHIDIVRYSVYLGTVREAFSNTGVEEVVADT